jgi:hypothetical protein
MKRRDDAPERRNHPRVQRELACELRVGGLRYPGIVRDLSARGLYVETEGEVRRGLPAVVAFCTGRGERFFLQASLPESRPPGPRALPEGGVSLHLENPPAAYLRWLDEAGFRP